MEKIDFNNGNVTHDHLEMVFNYLVFIYFVKKFMKITKVIRIYIPKNSLY